jgi:hypothetical protein
MTQADQVLKHMESGKTISPMDAMKEYGIMRLASRILDLRKLGYNIRAETASGLNRFGNVVRWREYWLEG